MRIGTVGAVALVLLAGCSPTTGEQPTTEPPYPTAQAWALDDGVVTEIEYRIAIDGFVSCMRNAGYAVTDPKLSPIDGLTLLYDLKPSGDPSAWNKKVEECDDASVSQIEPTYVESRDQVMAPALRTATANCLTDDGVRLSGTELNVKNFVDAAAGSGETVMGCVSASMKRLFPSYPGFLKVRW